MTDLDTQIAKAHNAAEATEQQARQLEARILKTCAQLPKRQYGTPVSTEALRQSLTARALTCKRDPELASYLGLQDGSYRRENCRHRRCRCKPNACGNRTSRLLLIGIGANCRRCLKVGGQGDAEPPPPAPWLVVPGTG